MKSKLILSAMLAGVLLFSAGCSGENTSSQQTSEHETQPTTEAPTEPTTLSYEEQLSQKADTYMESMTQYEKICQLFVVTPEELTGIDGVTVAGEATQQCLEQYPVGGIILFAQNIVDSEQFKSMTESLASYSKIPLLISTDEEGGDVARLGYTLDVPQLEPMYEYRLQGEAVAQSNAQTIADYLREYGINTDFAPVADVWSNPNNTVIGTRAYSDSFTEAAKLVSAAVKGFKSRNEICSLKHFPGHGDTMQDSHQELAHVTRTAAQLESEEFLTFKAGIDAGADMVMVGHLVIDELGDDTPATLNHSVVTGMLRKKLGFDGVAITDSMSMGAIVNNYGTGNAVLMAIKAGMDVILMPSDLAEAIDAVQFALDNGELTEQRLDESVKRVISMKIRNGLI